MSGVTDDDLLAARRIRKRVLEELDAELRAHAEGEAWKAGVAKAGAVIAGSFERFETGRQRYKEVNEQFDRVCNCIIGVSVGGLAVGTGITVFNGELRGSSISAAAIVAFGVSALAFALALAALGLGQRPAARAWRSLTEHRHALMGDIRDQLELLGVREGPTSIAAAERHLGASVALRLESADKPGTPLSSRHPLARVLGPRTEDNFKVWDHWCAEVLADLDEHGALQPWTKAGLGLFTMNGHRALDEVSEAVKGLESRYGPDSVWTIPH